MKLVRANSVRAPRRWAIVGPAIRGKTAFAMQMASPMVFVDADHRAGESVHLAKDPDNVFLLPKEDSSDARRIAHALEESIPGSGAKTIIVDSLTAIIKPLVNNAMLDNLEGVNTNKKSTFMEKGVSMSLLQDAVCRFGLDVLWIWHVEKDTFSSAGGEKESVTKTEYERLLRNLNAKLEILEDPKTGMLGVYVINLRPKAGQSSELTLWDESGTWAGMPEKIDAFLATIPVKSAPPAPPAPVAPANAQKQTSSLPFKSRDEALAHAVKNSFYADLTLAGAAYDNVKKEKAPKSAAEMFAFFNEHLLALPKTELAA